MRLFAWLSSSSSCDTILEMLDSIILFLIVKVVFKSSFWKQYPKSLSLLVILYEMIVISTIHMLSCKGIDKRYIVDGE
jgi:hypothetical protein